MKKVINIILIVLISLALIWFLTDLAGYYTIIKVKTTIDSTKVTDSLIGLKQWNSHTVIPKPDFDWSSLFSFLSAIVLFFLKYFFYDKENLKKKNNTQHNANHTLFLSLKAIDYSELPVVQLATPGKTLLYRQMIKLELEIVEDTIKEFLENNYEFKNALDFSNKVKKLILDISNRTSLKWNEYSVPKLVIDTYKELEYDRLLILNNAIDNISLYAAEDWDSAIREVLNHISTHIQLFITEDTIEVFSKLNGKLKGIRFQGVEL